VSKNPSHAMERLVVKDQGLLIMIISTISAEINREQRVCSNHLVKIPLLKNEFKPNQKSVHQSVILFSNQVATT